MQAKRSLRHSSGSAHPAANFTHSSAATYSYPPPFSMGGARGGFLASLVGVAIFVDSGGRSPVALKAKTDVYSL